MQARVLSGWREHVRDELGRVEAGLVRAEGEAAVDDVDDGKVSGTRAGAEPPEKVPLVYAVEKLAKVHGQTP